MNIPEWFQDPRIRGIAPEKLQLLLTLAEQVEGKGQREMMPILLGAVAAANRQNLQFSGDEFQLIFEIMKEGKSDEEKKKMDATLKRVEGFMKRSGNK